MNLYAPTSDKKANQAIFGKYIYEILKPYQGQNIIVGGDLNICVEDIKPSTLGHSSPTYNLSKLLEHLDPVDIWRLQNPNTKIYTRRKKNARGWFNLELNTF